MPPNFRGEENECAGSGSGHVKGVAKSIAESPALPDKPDMGYRATNALVAHDEAGCDPVGRNTRYIATMTRYITLHPGDTLWMGTDGVLPDIKPGDVVEVEITGPGVLRSPFIAEA